jgi:hypothetical protein
MIVYLHYRYNDTIFVDQDDRHMSKNVPNLHFLHVHKQHVMCNEPKVNEINIGKMNFIDEKPVLIEIHHTIVLIRFLNVEYPLEYLKLNLYHSISLKIEFILAHFASTSVNHVGKVF